MQPTGTAEACPIEKYYPLVRRVVLGIARAGLKSYIEVDDIVQEVAMRLPAIVERFDPARGASMETYLRMAIRARALDQIHAARRRGAPVDIASVSQRRLAVPPSVSISDIDIRSSEFFLSAGQYEVVRCCLLDGMTQEEAAERLGVTQQGISRRMLSAAKKIQEKFMGVL